MDEIRSDLARKSFTGLAQFTVAMALLLFLPAWSLHYWQGWLFLVVFCSACAWSCFASPGLDFMRVY